MAKKEYELKPRERRFADEYISNGRNATQAYRAISPNAKETTCATQGLVYLRKPNISEYIKDKTKERLNASNLTAQDVIDELIAIGFAKPQKGVSKQIDRLTNKVTVDIEYESTARHEDRLKALELLGKNLALFTDKAEIEHIGHVTFVDDIPKGE